MLQFSDLLLRGLLIAPEAWIGHPAFELMDSIEFLS
jgi:hypothetical protein